MDSLATFKVGAGRLRQLALLLTISLVLVTNLYTDSVILARVNLSSPRPAPNLKLPHPAPIKTARRLWILLIDGLGYEAAAGLPALESLAKEGVRAPVIAAMPAFTYPGITSLASGLPPLYSGVRLNGPLPKERGVDSIMGRAAALKRFSGIVEHGFPPFAWLIGATIATRRIELESLLRQERPVQPELIWLYLGQVDAAGHRSGAASERYREAARAADRLVARLRAKLDLSRDALVVLSDHGHRPEGGHGGPDPSRRALFYAAGRPFPKGVLLPAFAMQRIATTLALAAGLPYPLQAVGTPVAAAFGLPSARVVPLGDGDFLAERHREARWRLALTGLILLVLGVLLRPVLRELRIGDLRPLLVFVLSFFVLTSLAGYPMNFSMPRGGTGYIIDMALYGSLASVIAWASGHAERRSEEAIVMALALWIPYLGLGAWLGVDMRWFEGTLPAYLFLLSGSMGCYGCLPFALRAWLRASPAAISSPSPSSRSTS